MSTEPLSQPSFLGLEGQHVFITGAAGAIGTEAIREFLGRFQPFVSHSIHGWCRGETEAVFEH